jgi:hypothetical protein
LATGTLDIPAREIAIVGAAIAIESNQNLLFNDYSMSLLRRNKSDDANVDLDAEQVPRCCVKRTRSFSEERAN